MPELPEVETVVRDLGPLIIGRTISSIRVITKKLREPWRKQWNKAVINQRIEGLSRRGKYIFAALSDNNTLMLHLGMTGQLTIHAASEPAKDHIHLVFEFENGRELRFRDVRRFGSARLFEPAGLVQFTSDHLGPEPFDLDPGYFRKKLAATNRTLKAVLLDQKILAGVGNIYADESCFRSGLHPDRRADTLSPAEADRLRLAIEAVLTSAIEDRGSTIRDYIGGSGLKGTFQEAFAVYGRDGDACRTCSTIIQVQRIAGRSSHYCSKCQR
ncbi:DNA-formamidopyrimidine glycosylase [soil metagenome]